MALVNIPEFLTEQQCKIMPPSTNIHHFIAELIAERTLQDQVQYGLGDMIALNTLSTTSIEALTTVNNDSNTRRKLVQKAIYALNDLVDDDYPDSAFTPLQHNIKNALLAEITSEAALVADILAIL